MTPFTTTSTPKQPQHAIINRLGRYYNKNITNYPNNVVSLGNAIALTWIFPVTLKVEYVYETRWKNDQPHTAFSKLESPIIEHVVAVVNPQFRTLCLPNGSHFQSHATDISDYYDGDDDDDDNLDITDLDFCWGWLNGLTPRNINDVPDFAGRIASMFICIPKHSDFGEHRVRTYAMHATNRPTIVAFDTGAEHHYPLED